MGKNRFEAFSDGVIAIIIIIIITIMVLELKVPHGSEWADLNQLAPIFLSYVLSFINVGIYWNNHHHLLHTVHRVSAGILWSNMHLLFWLSLVPFTTGWMGENHFTNLPTAVYAFNLLMCAVAYTILVYHIIRAHGTDSTLAKALGHNAKGKISLVAYITAIPTAVLGQPWVAGALIFVVALMWFIPDRRIERALASE